MEQKEHTEQKKKARKTRADAQKNRQRILEVAAQAFDEKGVEVPMETIAKRAGVGAGTLYRHFPNREALVAAVLAEKEEAAILAADAAGTNSLECLFAQVHALGQWFGTYKGLTEPMRSAVSQTTSPLGMQCHDVISVLDDLIQQAREDGYIRPGVTGRDIYLLTLGTAWAAQHVDDPEPLYELMAHGWMA
ncbi:TetR/AcrR family transcriptional regulator [Corynebacterium sp. sy017]|uniref:TetR/AcrR family transcriptional regulator n=1 Tax=unclassified Corynebacterium TaxID=2624378 RepID=UPI0011851ECC|nr:MULTISPECIES: TetR/AcrR family transcriptional regulator [unclassified Corynebacterium]MBP3089126.1 TetR/AcrR family transcriptional regulator [Corynebacterium sp. sy017]TSD91440.1 TetR/AcrR family transcriptional regulator [Corynebacterium sp. SY003]